ncbi:MAG: response regulator, partial [Candidatus Thiodiazotropha taylori]|nr:response regulator [Candidatus Thiodiazotropha taylori]MCW4290791.1 response regulator [Candidatus Thiodiazotropha taylori]
MTRILLVDDDIASCRTLQLHLSGLGHEVSMAHSVDEGLQLLDEFKPGLVVLDIRMPGKSGLQGLPEFKSALPGVRIIMITAFHDMESTIEAMQKGADDYIHKPIDIDEFDGAVEKLLSHGEGELVETDSQNFSSLTMVGNSRAMKEIFKTIGLVAKSPATVLITGESGTGKELVARAIHRSGENPDGPFVVVNCA